MKAPTFLCLSLLLSGALLFPTAGAGEVDRVERGNLVLEDIPEIPSEVAERMRQYQNTRGAGFQGWHPSGEGILISTRFGETSQIHWVKEPGGARRQITFFDEPVGGATISPDPEVNAFLFGKDVGGSEFFQLFHFDLATGKVRMLSDGKSRNGGAVWAEDGRRFAYFTTERNGRDWDIRLADITQPGKSETILQEGGAWVAAEFSPDGRKLAVVRLVSANENYPYQFDLETKKLEPFEPADREEGEKIAFGGGSFAKDGQGFYFTSDFRSEFKRLQYHAFASGETRVLTGDIPWDVQGVELSDDGRYLAFTVNQDGVTRLYLRETATIKDVPLPELPVGQIFGLEFSPDGRELGMLLITPQTPGDVFSIDLESKKITRWTFSEVGGLDTDKFVAPRLIHYPTFDQVDGRPRMIPAFYYKPEGPGPFPVLINIHGGPEGQARPFFNPTLQYWINDLGLAVLYPNVRGSSGYGKSYLLLDNGYRREDTVKDIGKLLDWVAAQPDLDADRVGVIGGSYGGYMSLASMEHFNDRLRAGVDIVGISNFVTFLKNTQDYRRDLRRVEYGDERDQEMHDFLMKISPTTNVKKITKPLFIAQGLNDPRVPASESEQMVEEIRENGGQVWYMLAKDEGHGFRKKTNRDYYNHAVALFLEQNLIASPTGEAGAGEE